MQNYVKVVLAQGLLEEKGGRLGRGLARGWGPFIFSTNCHSQFVGLPLRLLLKTLLMLRESGRSRLGAAPPPQVPVPLLPGRRPCLPRSMPRRGICCVRAMEADSQSERFKLCDLARQAVQGRHMRPTLAGLGWTGSGGELAGCSHWGKGRSWVGRGLGRPRRAGAEVADRNVSTEPFSTIPKWLKYYSAPRRCG